MEQTYTIRTLRPEEIPAAVGLIWEVFLQFEAPEYPEEGIQTFRALLGDKERFWKQRFYGAFDSGVLVGTLCMRHPQHIGGFFVKANYHRKGIGRALFERMMQDYRNREFTVNSSPYAVEVYQHLGFEKTSEEQLADGIRYTPMRYHK